MTKLIVGLGNPGEQYCHTRHNLGFLVVDALALEHHVKFKKSAVCEAWVAKVELSGVPCFLLKPATFMNLSGVAVHKWVVKQGMALEDMLVITDDLALPFGQLRIRPSGTAGGHHGLESIIEHLGSKAFARLRMGISSPRPGADTARYVLANFTAGEVKSLPGFINHGRDCAASWAANGVASTMNTYNKKEGA